VEQVQLELLEPQVQAAVAEDREMLLMVRQAAPVS
jgi:hypothetical protein